MISKRSIVSTFHLFPPYMLSSLYDSNADIAGLDIESDSLRAINQKSDFQTTIYFKNDQITTMSCQCDHDGYCFHIIELIGYLYRNYDEVSSGESTLSTSKSKLFQAMLTPGSQDTFRKVLDIDSLLLNDEDQELEPFNDKIQFTVYSDQEGILTIEIKKIISWNSDKITEVRFKWSKKNLYVKCSQCSNHSDRLCEHQRQVLLSVDLPVLRKFIDGSYSIRKQYKYMADQFNIPVTILKNNYVMYFIEEDNVELKSKGNTHLVLSSNIESVISLHDIIKNDESEKTMILDDLYDEDHDRNGDAIVWAKNTNDKIVIKYVNGNLSKNKKKLTSHLTEIDKPVHIPLDLQTVLM